MVETYGRDDGGALHYLEGWTDKGSFVTHRGKVGSVGTHTRRAIKKANRPTRPSLDEHVAGLRARAAELGYREIPAEEHALVVLQVWTHTAELSEGDNARLLPGLVEHADEYLGWRGVGHCDGTDVGGARPDGKAGAVINLFCPVVDSAIGVRLLRRGVREFGLSQRFVIGAREPGPDAAFTLAYSPRKTDTDFRL